MPRDVVDYAINENQIHLDRIYIEVFIPFLEASITQNQVEMIELIKYRAIQSEELAMYVIEAKAAEKQAKLLEEARAREARSERKGAEENFKWGYREQ